jgi:hypothetical protein
MRISGRILRPSSLSERRILKSLGLDFIRVPRRTNPFAVARRIQRMSKNGELLGLKAMLAKPAVPPSLPDSTSEPRSDAEQRAA